MVNFAVYTNNGKKIACFVTQKRKKGEMKLSDNKESILHIRVTADMYNTLSQIAEFNGMSISAYVRMCLDYVIAQLYGASDGEKIKTN